VSLQLLSTDGDVANRAVTERRVAPLGSVLESATARCTLEVRSRRVVDDSSYHTREFPFRLISVIL